MRNALNELPPLASLTLHRFDVLPALRFLFFRCVLLEHIVLLGVLVLRVRLEHITLRSRIIACFRLRVLQIPALILLQFIRRQVTVFTDQLMDAPFYLFPA